ncbi:MAG TPA: hypothetical protein VMT47_16450 [Polyangia bacterium]|nr:hypothetical protein [Polyangia bacterium]
MTLTPLTRLFLAATITTVGVTAGCSTNGSEVDVTLAPHAYRADFGAASGIVPTVACASAAATACGAGQALREATSTDDSADDVNVDVRCDPEIDRCFAQALARLPYELDVMRDDAFVAKVEQRPAVVVRSIDLAYTLPVNTLTFDVPRIDVYVGPSGTKTEADHGVVLLDSISPVAAGATFVDEGRHVRLVEGSAAYTRIVKTIEAKQSFVFLVVAIPRLAAGAPLPAGRFEVDIFPTVSLDL